MARQPINRMSMGKIDTLHLVLLMQYIQAMYEYAMERNW